ncbi:MAG: rpoE [Parcubacteria group bacterium]|nr:rpoE [Parcubacteria group bacterium]
MDPFEQKLMGHYGPLFRYAWGVTRNHHDAEDLLHEVMCEALKYRADFASEESMGASLRISMRHRFYDMLRKRSIRISLSHKIQDPGKHIEANQALAAELNQVLFAIEMLPQAWARTLRKAVEGKSPSEIASEENIGLSEVHRRIAKARNKLRQILNE